MKGGKLFVIWCLLLGTSQLLGQDIYLKGKYLEVGIHPAFSFGSSAAPPPAALGLHTRSGTSRLGFVCDHNKDGWTTGTPGYMGDYFTPGSPAEGWGVQWGTTVFKRNIPLYGTGNWNMTYTSFSAFTNGSTKGATWKTTTSNGTSQQLLIEKRITMDTLSTYFVVTVFMKNVGTTSLSDLKYWRTVDPDNEQPLTTVFDTKNRILKQRGYNGNSDTALVEARGISYNVPIFLGAIDSRAYVSKVGFISLNASTIITNAAAPAAATTADLGIHLAFDFGTLDTGKCVTFSYFYALSDKDINAIKFPSNNDFSFKKDAVSSRTNCGDSSVKFYDYSFNNSLNVVSNLWDFENNGSWDANGDSAVYKFPRFGKFKVRKKVTFCNGSVNDTLFTVNILPKVVAGFAFTDSNKCQLSDTLRLVNKSKSIPPFKSTWTYVNGLKSTSKNISYSFTKDTTYTIKLVVVNDSGCRDSISIFKNFIKRPVPKAKFTTIDSSQCTNELFRFKNNSTVAYGANTYVWKVDTVKIIKDSINLSRIRIKTQGKHAIRLVAKSNYGCSDSITKYVTVLKTPVAKIGTSSARQCFRNNLFQFADSSTYNNTVQSRVWKFTDGKVDTNANLSHAFSFADSFTASIFIANELGCKDTAHKQLIVDSMPKAAIKINDVNQCFKENKYTFSNASKWHFGTITHNWLIADSAISAKDSVVNYSFKKGADTLPIRLVAITTTGCKDTAYKFVNLMPNPVANFVVNSDSQCITNQHYKLTSVSSIAHGKINYLWKYAGKTSASNPVVLDSLSALGSYTVWHIATSDSGCTDSISKSIFVNKKPDINLWASNLNMCYKGNTYTFVNNSTYYNDPLKKVLWQLSDSSTFTTDSIKDKKFLYADSFEVKLSIETVKGCKLQTSKNLIVYPNPIASFADNGNSQCIKENNFIFNSTAKIKWGTLDTFSWNFGDGVKKIKTIDTAQHRYLNFDTFNVQLAINSNYGCTDTVSKNMVVLPSPKAGFTVPVRYMCFNANLFNFINSSSIPVGTFTSHWNMGDGVLYDSINVSNKHYSSWGYYFPRLIVNSNHSCKDTFILRIGVAPKPTASFSLISDSAQCLAQNKYSISNKSFVDSGWIAYYEWNMGNDSAELSDTNIVNYTYAAQKTYTITSRVASNEGCKDSLQFKVTVWPQPKSNFSINDTNQCYNTQVFNYVNTSTIDYGNLKQNWILGNGNKDTAKIVSNQKYTHGNHQIKLINTSNYGCVDSTEKTIEIFHNTTPSFIINADKQCFNEHQFLIKNTSTLATGSVNYTWYFGDSTAISKADSVYKKFAYPDTFYMETISVTNNNCQDTLRKWVVVHPSPVSDFSVSHARYCFNNQKFLASNSSTVAYGSKKDTIYWGDNSNSNIIDTISHNYLQSKTYNLYLISTTNALCKDTAYASTTIDSMPKASFTINNFNQCLLANNYNFVNTSLSHFDTLSYMWQLGSQANSKNKNINNFHFNLSDSTQVKLVATNVFGCKDSVSQNIIIYPEPQASFTIDKDKQCFHNHEFNCTNNSIANVGSLQYYWHYDNVYAYNTTHLLNQTWGIPDSILIKLVVQNSGACKDSVEKMQVIYPEPKANFSINKWRQCFDNNSFNFTNLSLANVGANSFKWIIDQDQIATTTNIANYNFTIADSFQLKLIATNTYNCMDSAIQQVIVDSMPIANYSINNGDQCFRDNNFVASNLSKTQFGALQNNWFLNNVASSSNVNTQIHLTAVDTYQLKLVVYNSQGCPDSITKFLITRPMPQSNFAINTPNQCFSNNSVNFTNNSTIKYGSMTYKWLMGDNSTSTSPSISNKNYAWPDTFITRLIAISNYNCADTIYKPSIVHPKPLASFYTNKPVQCLAINAFDFFNTSTVKYNQTLNSIWKFGDNTQVNSTNFGAKTYATIGKFTATLFVSSPYGCIDSSKTQLTVLATPTALFSINTIEQCLNQNSYNFTNNSIATSGVLAYNWDLGDGNSATTKHVNNKIYSADSTYPVTLIVNDTLNCFDTLTQNVIVHPHPILAVISTPTCINQPYNIASVSTIKNTQINATKWLFSNGRISDNTQPITYFKTSGAQWAQLSVTSNKNCISQQTYPLWVHPKPKAFFTNNKSNSQLSAVSYQYTDQSTHNITNWTWSFSDNQKSNLQNPVITYPDTAHITTTLIVQDTNACLDTFVHGPQFVAPDFILHIPNAFSPDNDLLNDNYSPVHSKNYLDYSIQIFNRWGQMVYQSNTAKAWDGNYMGQPVQEGVYIYKLSIQDIFQKRHYHQGSIHLIR